MRLSQVGWTTAIVSCMAFQCQISKLQRVQKAAARIALDLSKFCHTTPALRQFHWLPIVKRILFKILLLSFKAIHGLSPPYISELITVKPKSTYGLRSKNSTLLLAPTQKMLPTLGARSFAAAAPALWNKLPADIRNVASLNIFNKSIKTFLFNESLSIYFLLFLHSILYLILNEIFVKRF